MTNTKNTPIEAFERSFPMRVLLGASPARWGRTGCYRRATTAGPSGCSTSALSACGPVTCFGC